MVVAPVLGVWAVWLCAWPMGYCIFIGIQGSWAFSSSSHVPLIGGHWAGQACPCPRQRAFPHLSDGPAPVYQAQLVLTRTGWSGLGPASTPRAAWLAVRSALTTPAVSVRSVSVFVCLYGRGKGRSGEVSLPISVLCVFLTGKVEPPRVWMPLPHLSS
jgi:hypothetical protein